jgi:hypothetical protein
MRPLAVEGIYFQEWTSDTMMQTVAIDDLRSAPFTTLWNLHMQPPALDTIRAVLAYAWRPLEGYALLHKVDGSLYILWACFAGILTATMFLWFVQTTNRSLALVATTLFAFHPGAILYATLLESSFISSVLIFLTYYLLWRLYRNPRGSLIPIGLCVLALFFTRSMFQGPWLLLFIVVLVLLRVPGKHVASFSLTCGLIMAAYLGKQYYQFGTLSTHGWRGLNLCRGAGNYERYHLPDYLERLKTLPPTPELDARLPKALTRREKLTNAPNLNHVSYIELNKEIWTYCKERFFQTPWIDLLRSFQENLRIYLLPSSRYVTPHAIVDNLLWRESYERVFSAPFLVWAVGIAFLVALATATRGTIVPRFALALPALFIFIISVIAEKDENMRFKIFIEPVAYLFVVVQMTECARRVSRWWPSQSTKKNI